MSCFLLGGLFIRSLTDRFRLFVMQPNGRFIELFLMDIIILNFINDELKSSDKKLPSQDSSIKQAIEKLIQSFENHWSVNWYCKKELFSNNVFRFFFVLVWIFPHSLTKLPQGCHRAVAGLSQGRRRAAKGPLQFFLVIFFFDIILSYSLLHLAAESHNSSQAEKIITVLQSWANSQNDTQNCPGCYHFE